MFISKEETEKWLNIAQDFIKDGNPNELLPYEVSNKFYGSAMSAYRFASLLGPGGDDDFFSSDLTASREDYIWGTVARAGIPVCVLEGGSDQYIPDYVDRYALVKRWETAYKFNGGKGIFAVVEDGNHTFDSEQSQINMWKVLEQFLPLV